MKKELDEQFFDDGEPAPPEDMGFFAPEYKKVEYRGNRKKEVEKAIEEVERRG